MRKATRIYRGNEINHYVTSVKGDLMQAWVDEVAQTCGNPHCRMTIPPGNLFTRHVLHWFNVTWKKRGGQPFCHSCIPFYADREE